MNAISPCSMDMPDFGKMSLQDQVDQVNQVWVDHTPLLLSA
jgi:hypothetical protein